MPAATWLGLVMSLADTKAATVVPLLARQSSSGLGLLTTTVVGTGGPLAEGRVRLMGSAAPFRPSRDWGW